MISFCAKRDNQQSYLLEQTLNPDAEHMTAIAALDCNDRLFSLQGMVPLWD